MSDDERAVKVGRHDADPLVSEFERAMYDIDDMPEFVARLSALVLVLARREAYWRGVIHGKGLFSAQPTTATEETSESTT